jgi:hypothetical protein
VYPASVLPERFSRFTGPKLTIIGGVGKRRMLPP